MFADLTNDPEQDIPAVYFFKVRNNPEKAFNRIAVGDCADIGDNEKFVLSARYKL